MSTDIDIILSSKQILIRKIWIKRRDSNGVYESSWVRVDYYKGMNRVKSFGGVSYSIDADPGEIGNFDASGLSIVLYNGDSYFSSEETNGSIFSNFLNRRLTKIKVEVGYEDTDGSEVGVTTIFEGIIDSVQIGDDERATVSCLSYIEILNSYPISDVTMPGSPTVSSVVNAIMNQSKITDYIPYIAASNSFNPSITTTNYDGTYWDTIKQLANESNSVPVLIGSTWAFKDRVPSASVVWSFAGQGEDNPDIDAISSYDDEGASRVYISFKESSSGAIVTTTNQLLLKKYLGKQKEISLQNYDTTKKSDIINALLSQWQWPRKRIVFNTRFFLNYINVLDRISISILGVAVTNSNPFVIDVSLLDGTAMLCGYIGAVQIDKNKNWMVIGIHKDIDGGTMTITAEEIL